MAAALLAPLLLLLLRVGQAAYASLSTTAIGPGGPTQFAPQERDTLTAGVEQTAGTAAVHSSTWQQEGSLEVELQEEGGKGGSALQEKQRLFVPLTKRARAGGAVYGVEVGEEGISRRKLELVGTASMGVGAEEGEGVGAEEGEGGRSERFMYESRVI